MNPVISLCHTTARLPLGWKKAADLWYSRADYPERIEYILGVDHQEGIASFPLPAFGNRYVTVNRGRQCAVDGWNATAQIARGKLLITVADDWSPCEHWDSELLKLIPDLNGEYVVKVNTGGDHGLLTFSILTRAYFERLTRDYGYQGGFFYPEYIGMYADNEFTDLVNRDNQSMGLLINATHLLFPHDHPLYTGEAMDEIHQRQHRSEAFEIGEQVYNRRRLELGLGPSLLTQFNRPLVICCVPGSQFSACWTANWTALWSYLLAHYRAIPLFGVSSNIYANRGQMATDVLNYPSAEFVLWLDSDNILTPAQFERMVEDLAESTLHGVAGWCWSGPGTISAGDFDSNHQAIPMQYEKLMDGDDPVKPVQWSGFPAFLMRPDALRNAGEFPFAAIIDPHYRYGMSGEDTAFCLKAGARGSRFAVDRRVKLPHLKLQPEEYSFPGGAKASQGLKEPALVEKGRRSS
jgi:hypothetical protein